MYSLAAFACVLFIALCVGILADLAASGRQANETSVKKGKLLLCAAFSLCFIWPVLNIGMYLIAPGCEFLLGTWGTGPVFQCLFNDLAFISGTLLAVLHYRLSSGHKLSDRFFSASLFWAWRYCCSCPMCSACFGITGTATTALRSRMAPTPLSYMSAAFFWPAR